MARVTALVAGICDTKGQELRYIADLLAAAGIEANIADMSTGSGSTFLPKYCRGSGVKPPVDGTAQAARNLIPATEIAAYHPDGIDAVLNQADRGFTIAAISLVFERFTRQVGWITGMIGLRGSGDTDAKLLAILGPCVGHEGY